MYAYIFIIQVIGSVTLFRKIWKKHTEIEERTPTDHDMCSICVEYATKRERILKRVRAGEPLAAAALADHDEKNEAHCAHHAVERRVHDVAKITSENNSGPPQTPVLPNQVPPLSPIPSPCTPTFPSHTLHG